MHLEIQGWIASLGIHHRLSDSPPLLELTQTPPPPWVWHAGLPILLGWQAGPSTFLAATMGDLETWAHSWQGEKHF